MRDLAGGGMHGVAPVPQLTQKQVDVGDHLLREDVRELRHGVVVAEREGRACLARKEDVRARHAAFLHGLADRREIIVRIRVVNADIALAHGPRRFEVSESCVVRGCSASVGLVPCRLWRRGARLGQASAAQ